MKFITLLAFFVATISLGLTLSTPRVNKTAITVKPKVKPAIENIYDYARYIGYYGKHHYFLSKDIGTEAAGRTHCQKISRVSPFASLYMAKIDSIEEAVWLSNGLKSIGASGFAYVDSWQGNDYGKACLAIYAGAPVIVTPREGCAGGRLPVVCETVDLPEIYMICPVC